MICLKFYCALNAEILPNEVISLESQSTFNLISGVSQFIELEKNVPIEKEPNLQGRESYLSNAINFYTVDFFM